jgi:hypothetical protein
VTGCVLSKVLYIQYLQYSAVLCLKHKKAGRLWLSDERGVEQGLLQAGLISLVQPCVKRDPRHTVQEVVRNDCTLDKNLASFPDDVLPVYD